MPNTSKESDPKITKPLGEKLKSILSVRLVMDPLNTWLDMGVLGKLIRLGFSKSHRGPASLSNGHLVSVPLKNFLEKS